MSVLTYPYANAAHPSRKRTSTPSSPQSSNRFHRLLRGRSGDPCHPPEEPPAGCPVAGPVASCCVLTGLSVQASSVQVSPQQGTGPGTHWGKSYVAERSAPPEGVIDTTRRALEWTWLDISLR